MPQIDPFQLSFTEAIDYFKAKIPLPSTSWDTFADAAADTAFTIAQITDGQLLGDVYNLLLSAMENGDTYHEFKKGFSAAVERSGWTGATPWRTQLIFMQNLRSAHGAGRYEQMREPEMLKLRGFWMWRHRDSRVPRKHHLALDSKVFPADSGFWDTAYPPSGWGCRCSVFAISQPEIDREGLEVSEPPTETVRIRDKVTGEAKSVPAIDGKPIAEPGFTTAPGASSKGDREAIIGQAIQKLPEGLQAQVREALNGR